MATSLLFECYITVRITGPPLTDKISRVFRALILSSSIFAIEYSKSTRLLGTFYMKVDRVSSVGIVSI